MRIYDSNLSLSYEAARKLAKKILNGEVKDHFDARTVYRKEWALLTSKDEVQSACEVLTEAGWLRVTDTIEKGKHIRHYAINPKIDIAEKPERYPKK